jgi:CMP-N-acetylneuraminic acid synthetase
MQVAVVINARLESSRLPNKLVLPFSGSSLIEVALAKLSAVRVREKYLAAYDPEIIELYKKYENTVGLLRRKKSAVTKGQVPHRVAFAHYEMVEAPYIMVMNPCHPLTTPSTYEMAIDKFGACDAISLTSVVKKINIFFGADGRMINRSDESEVKTHNQSPVFEMAHVFHIFPKDVFLSTGQLWNYTLANPKLYEVTKLEALDVDDQEDFDICESIFRRHSKE